MIDQRQRIADLEWGLKQVYGTGARDFGAKLKEVYRFYKENGGPQEADQTNQTGGN